MAVRDDLGESAAQAFLIGGVLIFIGVCLQFGWGIACIIAGTMILALIPIGYITRYFKQKEPTQ